MLQIKFSHNYPKLHGQKKATLLQVIMTKRNMLTDKFIEYDTNYDGGKYPLRDGDYLVLVFIGDEKILFTTVRPYTAEKCNYYTQAIRYTFDIVIEDISIREILKRYNDFLIDRGYCDDDIWSEDPEAIEEFLNDYENKDIDK